MNDRPIEARCDRCKQRRPVFPYKPLHDCVRAAGAVSLIDAARRIVWIEEEGDTWCRDRLEGRKRLLCVPCHDREAQEETDFVKENEL